MTESRSDEELVAEARAAGEGDARAFESLVGRYKGKVTANCRYITRSPRDAEDLAQEVFVKVYFAMKRFEGRSSFRTWLQRIKVNHCLNHLKRGQGQGALEIDDLDEPAVVIPELRTEPEGERAIERGDERERIAAVLDGMTDALRVPLILRDFDQWSYQEIADALGVGLSATKMRIKRAREEFQRRFGGEPVRVASAPGERA